MLYPGCKIRSPLSKVKRFRVRARAVCFGKLTRKLECPAIGRGFRLVFTVPDFREFQGLEFRGSWFAGEGLEFKGSGNWGFDLRVYSSMSASKFNGSDRMLLASNNMPSITSLRGSTF